MSDSMNPRREDAEFPERSKDVTSELTRETDWEILEVLVERSPLHVMDLAKIVDHHPITVDQTCARLHEREHIFPLGRGLYDVTDRGKRQLDGNDDP